MWEVTNNCQLIEVCCELNIQELKVHSITDYVGVCWNFTIFEDSERKGTGGYVLLHENYTKFDNSFSVAKKWVGMYHVISTFLLNVTANLFFSGHLWILTKFWFIVISAILLSVRGSKWGKWKKQLQQLVI